MNDGTFGVYDDGVGWTAHHRSVKTEATNFLGYVESPTVAMGDNYGASLQNYSDSLNFSHRQQPSQQQISYHQLQQHQHSDNYHSPSYYGVMDSHTLDDFEAFTRERCHTWPGIQQRAPGSFGPGQQQNTDDDSNQQHQFSPPPLPSRGSSGLSLISESNESLLATPTSAATTQDGGDWNSSTVGSVGGGYLVREYGNLGSNANINQSPATTTSSVSPLPVTTTSNKRSLTATPSYKSGHPSYVELITQAILSSAEKRMTLSEIYDWMVANVPSFKDQRHLHSSAGWKNSVRHNLSLHARFKRVKRNGMDKPSWWTVDLSEEAKRERSKRPRQSRPRANTTTATSREIHNQRQQQRQVHAQGQNRASLGFAQPQLPHQSDHASSGHGSMSFSGSVTPASSIGSDIFLMGTTTASSAGQFGIPQQPSTLLQDSLMPPPPPQLMASNHFLSTPLDGSIPEDCMEWTHYSNNSAIQLVPAVRVGDQLLENPTNVAEASNLHCLSQAITVSLRDPTSTAADCKPDVALNLTATTGSAAEAEAVANYFGTMTSGNVTNLVQAFRQNTLDEGGNQSSAATRQLLRVQTNGGHIQEINSPTRSSSSHSPMASCVLHQQQIQQGLTVASSPQQLSPAPGAQPQRQLTSVSPAQGQYCSSPYPQIGNLRKVPSSSTGVIGQLPDDLATLDVGGLDCNIMDVLSYEMNCNSNNTGFA